MKSTVFFRCGLGFCLLLLWGGNVSGLEPLSPSDQVSAFLGVPENALRAELPAKAQEIYGIWEQDKKRKAFQVVKKWMKKEKKSPYPWVVAASLYYQLGRYKTCLSMGKKALKKMPQNPEAYFWRGRAYESLGKPMEAANEYQAALMARKEFSPAKEGLNRALVQLKFLGEEKP